MKCKYALKHIHSDSISVKVKNDIDEHIAHCAFCQGQLVSNTKVAHLIEETPSIQRDYAFWQSVLNDIRAYREKKQYSPFQRLLDLLPLEPVVRRAAMAGVAACAILIAASILSLPVGLDRNAVVEELPEDEEFFIQEHNLAQDSGLFGGDNMSRYFTAARGVRR